MEQLKTGDTVKLKSGLSMAIKFIDKDEAYCEWFNDKNEPKGGRYG